MSIASTAFAIVSTALCFTSLLGFANSRDILYVEGKVFCDTCGVEVESRLSENLRGARVRLECKNRTTYELTFSAETTTDKDGWYRLAVDGDHEDEICEVKPLSSGNPNCNEPLPDRTSARVLATKKNGIVAPVRFANSLGFLRKQAHPDCKKVFEELNFAELGIDPGQRESH